MKNNYLWLLLLITQLSFPQQLINDVIAAAGEQFTYEKGTLNHTTGEIVSSTIKNQEVTLTQGFQQTYVPSYKATNPEFLDAQISIYPNPTKGHFSIKVSIDAEFSLYNVLGQLINIKGSLKKGLLKSVNITHLEDGVYLLKIKVDEDSYKSYKIIKNK